MTEAQHRELLDVLAGVTGKFMLSGYPSDLYRQWEVRHGWNRHEFLIDNKASSGKVKETKTECLWCNFQGISMLLTGINSVGIVCDTASRESQPNHPSRINFVRRVVLLAFPFVPAQRVIRLDSLAHRARNPDLNDLQRPNGPTIRRQGPSFGIKLPTRWAFTSFFASRADGPGYLNCCPFGPKQKNKLKKYGVVSGRVLSPFRSRVICH